MKLVINRKLIDARCTSWPTIETADGLAIGPDEPADLLRRAGVELVEASASERSWLRRHGFRLPESRDRRDSFVEVGR